MCTTFSRQFQGQIEVISSTKRVSPENSSDLERGAAPRSIDDEKSGVTLLVVELNRSQGSEHFRSPAMFLPIVPIC